MYMSFNKDEGNDRYQVHRVDELTLHRLKMARDTLESIIADYENSALPLRRPETLLRQTMHLLKSIRSDILHSGDY